MIRPSLVVLAIGATAVTLAGTPASDPPGLGARSLGPGGRVAQAPDLDSARAELELGRHWHAARHLRELREAGAPFGPAETLLLARAEAGYRSWPGVIATLEGAEWLSGESGGLGIRLLARAREGLEEWARAADAYGDYLSTPHGGEAPDRAAIVARRVRSLARAGAGEAALSAMDSLHDASAVTASWLGVELAEAAGQRGDTAFTRAALGFISSPEARERAWELRARALLAAADSARALGAYRELEETVTGDARRARIAAVMAGLLAARGDTAEAVDRYRRALEVGPRTGSGAVAARRLLELDSLGADRALTAAGALRRSGANDLALRAYDLLLASGAPVTEQVRLDRARLMAGSEGRADEAVRAFRSLGASEDAGVGAAALEAWAALRRRQGRTGDVRTLRRWLVERYPASAQAVEYVFLRGDAAQDRQELAVALADYGRVQDMAPTLDRAGLARMRMAQIHLLRGDSALALEEFRTYLERFPDGRRWEEATFWAGLILEGTGRSEEGRRLLASIADREPLSYYAVLAAEELEVPYRLPGVPSVRTGGIDPAGDREGLPPAPSWMDAELRLVDLLHEAGLEEGRARRVQGMTRRALEESTGAALRLAEELAARELTLEAINLGWELRRRGAPWSRALLRAIYPLTNREMLWRAAAERGLDPLLVAALIRQESAFDPDVVSRAGAVGLMQVLPPTGRQLAAAVGPRDFDAESLVTPEINLHLGTRYLLDLWRRYDGYLPLVLSAYNAGPSRAEAWKRFPEAGDPLRFVERIPFRETRDYVKLVRRNLTLYAALYGDEPAS